MQANEWHVSAATTYGRPGETSMSAALIDDAGSIWDDAFVEKQEAMFRGY